MHHDNQSLPRIRVYSRPGCHLCEVLVEQLLPIVRGQLNIEVVDIDSRPDWRKKFGIKIPVVEYRQELVCQYTLDVAAIRVILAELAGSQTC